MALSETDVLNALGGIPFPGFERDIVALGVVRGVHLEGDAVRVELDLPSADPAAAESIEQQSRDAVLALAGVRAVELRRSGSPGSPSLRMVGSRSPRPSTAAGGALDEGLIPQVRHTIAVASGKGGVGKSTIAVNLAVALSRRGARVGLLDADIYGPSIPLMTGLQDARPTLDADGQHLIPFERHGVRLMSLGFLLDRASAVIWRGPMVMKAIEQLLRDVRWGELDVLVVDMPPGTGDAQLTLSQRVHLAGSVIVTTPQDVALADAIKGVAMFRKVGVPILGIVENMSFFLCPHCAERSEIFGHGGGRTQSERLGVPFLAEVPLDAAIRSSGDEGEPVAVAATETPLSRIFHELAGKVLQMLEPPHAEPEASSERSGLFDRLRKIRGRSGSE